MGNKNYPPVLKRLGQNFLTSDEIALEIIYELDIQPGDTVLEIGPGRGRLTNLIFQYYKKDFARFIAVEADPLLAEKLADRFSADNTDLIVADFLKVQLKDFRPKEGKKLKIIGNIPYNITSEILMKVLSEREVVDSVVLMMQDEVANRLIALPNSKSYGRISVILQAFAEIEKAFIVEPQYFKPKPKVHSAIVRLLFTNPHGLEDSFSESNLSWLVKMGFKQRRKKLVNNLKFIWAQDEAKKKVLLDALEQIGQTENARAEQVSVKNFIKLSELLENWDK